MSRAVGDFNDGALPDLAVTNEHSGDVTILLGAPAGAFAPVPFSPLPVGPARCNSQPPTSNHDLHTDIFVNMTKATWRCRSGPTG